LKVQGVKLRVFEDQGGISKRLVVQGGSCEVSPKDYEQVTLPNFTNYIFYLSKVSLDFLFVFQCLKNGNVLQQSIKNSKCDQSVNNFHFILQKLLKRPNCPYIFLEDHPLFFVILVYLIGGIFGILSKYKGQF
jgi:hypothetical protein